MPSPSNRSPPSDRAWLLREVADSDVAGHGAFYRYEAEECVAASFSRRVRSRFDGDRRDGDSRPGEKGLRSGARLRARRAVSAPAFPARVSSREAGANPHRNHARRGLGRFGRGRSGGKDFRSICDERKVLVLGAGETSERTARALVAARRCRHPGQQPIGRTRGKRWRRWSAAARSRLQEWANQCREIDILITSTARESRLLTRDGSRRRCFGDRLGSAAFHHRYRGAAGRRARGE